MEREEAASSSYVSTTGTNLNPRCKKKKREERGIYHGMTSLTSLLSPFDGEPPQAEYDQSPSSYQHW